MKPLKRILCLFLALCCIVPFTACKGGKLEVPFVTDLNEENVLIWDEVTGARMYKVEIASVDSGEKTEETTRYNEYSLSDLAVGDYEIRIQAVGGQNNDVLSDWSEVVEFHRDYESGLRYSLINNNTEYAVTKVGSAEGAIVMEDTYRGKPVTEIADGAFRASGKLEGITVGKNVRSIGDSAFYNCTRLTFVTLPDTVEYIGESAFQNCNLLESFTMPSAVETLSDYAFAYCRTLTSLDFGETIRQIGASAFSNCSGLKSLEFPDSVISVGEYAFTECNGLTELSFGRGTESIGNYAFYGCDLLNTVSFSDPAEGPAPLAVGDYAFSSCNALEEVALPEGTVSIGLGSFMQCEKLSEIAIPDSVTSVGAGAFNGSALYSAQTETDLIYADKWLVGISDNYFETVKNIVPYDFKEGTVGIADQAFIKNTLTGVSGCLSLVGVSLPESVAYIGNYAFYSCPKLETLTALTGGLKSIGDWAFSACQVLSNVRFADGLETIGSYAFYGCELLNNNTDPRLLIPDSVTHVGTRAFYQTALWEMPDENGVIYAGNWVVGFDGSNSVVSLRTGDIDGIADYAFYVEGLVVNNTTLGGESHLESVQGLSRARRIGNGAFYNCTMLTSVSLNASLRTIGAYTFYNCASLFRVNFPTMLTAIDRYAFYKCSGLNGIDLSVARVETIGERAFYGCSNVRTIDLGTRVETIGERAFYHCASIAEVTIPDSTVSIGDCAFAKCELLLTVRFGNGLVSIGESAFRESALKTVSIPDSVKEIGDFAFYKAGCDALYLGKNVEKIGRYAFGATAIKGNLVIPESVKEIGDYAFVQSSLSSVIFLGNVTMGSHVFHGCNGLTIYLKDGLTLSEGAWNSSFRPVVYGCAVSELGEVASVTKGEVLYGHALGGVGGPALSGYDFVGWATSEGGEVVYTPEQFLEVEEGVTLYPVYAVHTETEEPEPEEPEEPAPEEPASLQETLEGLYA